ncbi:MAG: hypothetical protein ACE5ER_06310 [Nitrospinaceae bacterium]
MPYSKTIICLSNSRKPSGRCIAGKEISQNNWIRPVSQRSGGELSEEDRCYEDGHDPQVLDIIDVPMLDPSPHLHQQENHIIDENYFWKKTGSVTWEFLQYIVDNPPTLWMNNFSSSYGENDRVPRYLAPSIDYSLILLKPNFLNIHVGFEHHRRRVRASFRYKDEVYSLIVTDPIAEQAFRSRGDGDYPLQNTYLCLSLGEAFEDSFCYKLIVAIIGRQPF